MPKRSSLGELQITPYHQYFVRGTCVFVSFLLLSIVSILFIDKPFALWIHEIGSDQLLFLRYITETTQYWLSITYITVLLIFPTPQLFKNNGGNIANDFKTSQSNNLSARIVKIIYFIFVVLIALWIKTKLKIFFGRDWPLRWGGSHLGLIPDGIYQFNILNSKFWQGSFPSGHATLVATASIIMYLLYPRAKYLWLILALVVIIAILMLNYHFIGDCLAGVALGGLCAYYGVAAYYFLIKIMG